MIDQYVWAGGREAMLRFGPDAGPVVILALPLFEEANRTRAFAVSILRVLAGHGIAGVLPDLPGQGESEKPLEDIRLDDCNGAISSLAASIGAARTHIAAIRSGILPTATASARSRWTFAPQEGPALIRDLLRTRQLAGAPPVDIDAPGAPIEIAGNIVSRALLRELRDAAPDRTAPHRTLRLADDPAVADRKIAGAPLWRRSEPGNDIDLAETLAADIVDWIAACDR